MINSNKIQQLDLNLLKVFQALYQEQNMTRTAELLFLTPSAVSHAIKRLREALNDPLFIRSQNKMVPTPACQRMAPAIIDNLNRLHQILQQWGEFDPSSSTYQFRIGMHDAFESSLLPSLISVLSRKAPNIGIASIKVNRNNLERELSSGHMDIALDVSMPIKKPVIQHKLLSSNFCVLMRSDHPLRDRLTQVSYLDAQHISVSNRPLGMTVEDTFFQRKGIQRNTSIHCQNYFAAAQILLTSDQLLTVNQSISQQLLSNKLASVDLPFKLPEFKTSLYWHENSQHDSALNWLRNLLINMDLET